MVYRFTPPLGGEIVNHAKFGNGSFRMKIIIGCFEIISSKQVFQIKGKAMGCHSYGHPCQLTPLPGKKSFSHLPILLIDKIS
jgi:hypothetical protein